MILWLVGCGTEGPPPKAVEPATLAAPRLLRRMALDLVGRLPSLEELDAVDADPSRLDAVVETYLDDPAFEDRFVDVLASRWWTVMDEYEVSYADYGLPEEDADRFAHSVGEEPLRLIARVVAEDRPYSEIVTADWTMSNDLLAGVWPIDWPDGQVGWQPAHYTDGRPAAGVLATNGFYWRYVTNVSNKNRGRAAAVSRLLLCTDILARPVELKRSSTADAEEAIRTEPACVSCHSAVDPLAAHFFGFWWMIQYNPYEMQTYHPERELLADAMLDTSPGYYGTPTEGLADLGWYIADDARFGRCAAQTFAELFWRRPTTLEDFDVVEGLRAGFEPAESPRALLRAVLATPEYRDATARLLTPDQQAGAVAGLTGFDWQWVGWDQMGNDAYGYRVLAGGVDGYTVTAVQDKPGLTWMLVNERLAQAGAHALLGELGVDPPRDADLESLYWRMYAERPDANWKEGIAALWATVVATDGPEAAWEAVIEAMLRDPRFVEY